MASEDVSPIRQQYLDIKRQHPNVIVFFRLGDFYETFDEDAETTARELDIVLTSRNVAKGSRVPMAGIPYHAVENYISKLVQKGFRIAICEQIGDAPVDGLFPRQVVRIVTPGTLIEPGLLPSDHNNFLAAVVLHAAPSTSKVESAALAYADISTGEFAVAELNELALRAELRRLRPAEVIHPDQSGGDGAVATFRDLDMENGTRLTAWPPRRFEARRCEETLRKHFAASTLDGFGLTGRAAAISAAGAILQYVEETQPQALKLLTTLRMYAVSDYMVLDPAARRNLELDANLRGGREGSLLSVLDQTVTPMGRRMMHRWMTQPLLDAVAIHARQNGVQYFLDRGMERAELRAALKPLIDIERVTNRIVASVAQPRELAALREALIRAAAFPQLLPGADAAVVRPQVPDNVVRILKEAISDEPPATLQSAGAIRPGYSAELDGVTEASRHAREWIAGLEAVERQKTGIKTLKVGYNKVFGYYIEISRGAAAQAPEHYIRKQTLVNAERFITPEMKEYETLVLNAEEQIRHIETRLFREVCTRLADDAPRLLELGRALAELDVLASLAEVAALRAYCRPEVHAGPELEIEAGRHPVVEQSLRLGRYVPNDLVFEAGEVIRIVTGPNMSGKSTYLRQNALIVLMAQIGSFVPARRARVGIVDRIFTRIGAQDEIHAGQSTFMVEMVEAANILHHATERSLLILDELGRGTSTYDGLSIAWSVVEYIHNHPRLRAKTLFATHYHEMTQLASLLPGIRNYSVAVTEQGDQVIFLHQIVAGGADRSYGIHVAQMAGLPGPVVQRANEILHELEKSSGQVVKAEPFAAQQMALFPETSALLDELSALDVDALSPVEALNLLFVWKSKFTP